MRMKRNEKGEEEEEVYGERNGQIVHPFDFLSQSLSSMPFENNSR